MNKIIVAGAILLGFCGAAGAEARYDRSLDQAAAAIVAAKIGAIRGGFAFDARPAFVSASEPETTGTVRPTSSGWDRGLARARDASSEPPSFN